ncbi:MULTISPECIES: ABC transporter permease [Novosphingobium]|jgi:ABC-2 type transport system permease protein/capsular polysaccharide transport system permease protein|uniref:ABC transporter permease n=1 Tax=Novosphingobium TaxID=165696 RepID=UPI0022F26AB1|nr:MULTISPECIES: ABC transporter permease [Novosphingobium]GLK44138.1 transport permease protein [Novosphingobium resinovorum]
MSSLIGSARVQGRVIHALLMREVLTRYGRHNIGFLWLFVEPMIFTLGVAALWSAFHAVHGSSLPIVAFAVTGYSSILLWRNMGFRTIGAIEPNLSLLYHRNIKPIDIYLSRLLLEVIGATASFVVVSFIFGMMSDDITWPENLAEVIAGWTLLAWFGVGLAILAGAVSEEHEFVEKLWHPAQYLLVPLSGAAFQVDALPTALQKLALYLPMVNGVEIVREGFFGSKFHAHYDVGYLVTVNTVLTVLGLAQLRKIAREITPE